MQIENVLFQYNVGISRREYVRDRELRTRTIVTLTGRHS